METTAAAVTTLDDLGRLLRELRRRQARQQGGAQATYRDLAAATGWSHGIVGAYLSGQVLPPTDRFDVLIRLLGATPAEQGSFATARDRVEEARRSVPPAPAGPRQLPAAPPGFAGRAEPWPPWTTGSTRRDTAWLPFPVRPESARQRWRCTGRTASPTASRTASST